MFCSRMGNGIPITCTTTYQKWTGQPITSAGSKNPLPLGMGSVKDVTVITMGISSTAEVVSSIIVLPKIIAKYEYYGAAEPPVRCGESHLSGLTEPLRSL